jgi:hypothetical protein
MRRLLWAALAFVFLGTPAFAAVTSGSVVTPQIPNRGFVQFLPAASAATSSIAANAATSATGTISGPGGVGGGNILTLTAGLSGTFVNGATLSGTGVANNITIVMQLSGAAGGLGTYLVTGDRAQSVASTTITATYGVLTIVCACTGTFEVGGQLTGGTTVITGLGTFITQLGTGVGGAGTYYVNNATVVAATTITQDAPGTYKTLYTAGPNSSKCFAFWATTNDSTASHLLTVELATGIYTAPTMAPRRVGGMSASTTVNGVIGGQGYVNNIPAIQLNTGVLWPGLPSDTDGNPYGSINYDDAVQATFATAQTAATKINIVAHCADF